MKKALGLYVKGSEGAAFVLVFVSSRESVRSLLFRTILVSLWALRQEDAGPWLGSWRGTENTGTRGELEAVCPLASMASAYRVSVKAREGMG